MKARYTVIAGVAALAISTAAQAAQEDYFLKIDTVDGEALVSDWSFGACNAGQCTTVKSPRDAASGLATGKRQHKPSVTASQNTQSLRDTPDSAHQHHGSDASAGAGAKGAPLRATYDLKENKGARLQVAAGDVDGDGTADFAYAATLNEVSSLTLTFQKVEATWQKVCMGKHIASATLRSGSDSFQLTDVTVTCGPAEGSTRKQTQGATFGERCDGNVCAVDDWHQQMVLTGGQMKHNKTGHVTLMK